MKKLIACAALIAFTLTMSFSSSAQQGSWAGSIKYKLTWAGSVPQGVPQDWTAKVYKNLEGSTFFTYISMGGLSKSIHNSANKTVTTMFDFSMFPDEGAYEGMQGKWYLRSKIKDEDLAKFTYTFTGKTKELAGKKCEEVIQTVKGENGDPDQHDTLYATKELGPEMNIAVYPGLQAFPMEYTVQLSDELTVTFTAEEVKDKTVKEEDLMLETGYEEISAEDFNEWMQKLRDAQQEGGEGDDDM